MRLIFEIKRFCFIFIFLAILMFQNDFENLNALNMENYQDGSIVEELRLEVPAPFKKVWLETEKTIWEPWLNSQKGFLGRQLFWNKDKEEALILVNWESKKLWKTISIEEVNKVQEEYENSVKTALNVSENPFKLIYEGELVRQG